ncbi:2'-5' RNA ligase family protein [Inquilinus limosus]|uniref:2'-5' RNA ligase family protein n=1 Tax=Inquilinus limosus TaxID=171674 RepID=UPI003F18E5B1
MQGVFNFYEPLSDRPRRPERVFFCVLPDDETRDRVARFGDGFFSEYRLMGTRLRTDRLHVSLHHVGDYKRLRTKFVYAAQQAGKAVSMGPFEVAFRFVKSFEAAPHKKGRRPLVLLGEGGEALVELFRSLGIALTRSGLKAAAEFTPHMTLSYGPDAIPEQAIEPIRFVVKDFALIHSRLGLTRYEVIDRWSLQA